MSQGFGRRQTGGQNVGKNKIKIRIKISHEAGDIDGSKSNVAKDAQLHQASN